MKPTEITLRIEGKLHTGTFTADDTLVTVTYHGKSMATQVGGSPPEAIAGMLLRELVREGRHRA